MAIRDECPHAIQEQQPHDSDSKGNRENTVVDSLLAPLATGRDHHGEHPELSTLPVETAEIQAAARIVYHTDPRSASADRFRLLRMRLRELQASKKLKTLLLTSPLPHDGKSTMVLNLATVLAEGGKRTVLVVEGDLHRPTFTQQLGLRPGKGLADCLVNHSNPMSAIRRIEPLGWYLLPAGGTVHNPTELLQTETLTALMHQLSAAFEWILIDSPPVVPLADTLSLAKNADSSLLIVKAGHTPRQAVDEAITLLGRQQILGIILNGIEGLDRYYSGNGYSK